MSSNWCGKTGLAVALSAGALAACAPRSYELGKESGDGTGGTGASAGSSGKGGKSSAGTGGNVGGDGEPIGKGGKGGTNGTSGTSGTDGGDAGSEATGARGGGGVSGGGPAPSELITRNKLDLLFVIDNSIGMVDKQERLARAIPALMARLLAPSATSEFSTLEDVHIGVITSSLGDHGSDDVCSDAQNAQNVSDGLAASQYNDKAQLLPSVREGADSDETAFLAWEPGSKENVGENVVDQLNVVGERGCGYEAPLEAWYRFLVNPEPVEAMRNDGAVSIRGPVNEVVLAQRAAFLRPDSVLAIVMLTDENDCSIADEDQTQSWLVGYKGGVQGTTLWHMPRATSVCDVNPSDACCHPCSDYPTAGCPADSTDAACSAGNALSLPEDSMNMRCFKQKQRFGIDFLYEVGRYTEALTSTVIVPRYGGVQVKNPLFLAGGDGPARTTADIYLTGIVGVPWQDLAMPGSLDDPRELTFMTAAELAAEGRWNVILGDRQNLKDPADPLMIESIDPRPTGAPHPLVDTSIGSPDSTDHTNSINGHEQVVRIVRDELQFACIYPLDEPVPCNDDNADSCDCNYDEFSKNSPLCEGVTATKDGTQVFGKAYPSLRELEVLRSVGNQAVVASVCPKHAVAEGDDDPNVGYTPALSALLGRLQANFNEP